MNQKSFRKFTVIWFGQFVSILGSGLSSFGLSVWILTTTKSTMSFAMTFLINILPSIFFSPLAGSFADRKSRKWIMLLSDSCDAALKMVLALLWFTGKLNLTAIYTVLFFSSIFNTFQSPAFNASIPEIVPKEKLGRANGMMQIIMSVQNLVAPVAAGILYPLVQFGGLLAIDIATYAVGFLTLVFQDIPQPYEKGQRVHFKSVMSDLREAFVYIRQKAGFLDVIAIFAVLNFIANTALVLVGPLVLSHDSSLEYGLVNSASGAAMLVGSLLAGLLPSNRNRIKRILFSLTLSGVGLVLMGLSPLWYTIAVGFFVFMLPVPYVNGNLGTIIQTKVDGYILGRVSALLNALLRLVMPLAFLSAGYFADHIFNPLLSKNGAWSKSIVARVIGTGETRGIGLIFILCGIFLMLLCSVSLGNKKAMSLETQNPDVIKE